jgi:hypothetical protein
MFAHAARAAGRVAGGGLAVHCPVRAATSACAAVPRAAGCCAIWGASGVARQCAASSGDRLANSPRAVTETRRRQTPPTHPPQPPPADQHAALACAGWLVKGAMDCFRAVFQSHETSERAFHLTSKGIDNKPANYTVWYATNVATLVVQTRATSPVGGQSVGGRRVGVAIFVCRNAERCAQRPLWLFGLASSSSSLGLAVLWHSAGQCAARLCKGWWCVLLSGHPACVNAAAHAAGTFGGR